MIIIAKHKVEITGINTSEIKVLTEKEKQELSNKKYMFEEHEEMEIDESLITHHDFQDIIIESLR